VFAANVISALGTASEQGIVETENKGIDTKYVEDFQKAAFTSANARLQRQGKLPLNPFLDEQACIRGGAAARCIFRMKDGVLIPDITPWDTRFVTYEMGETGLDYAAYHTTRTKDKIEAEYGIVIVAKEAKVLDVWDAEHNEVWVDEEKVLEQQHSFGFTPVVVQLVSLGSMLADQDALQHHGESIFFLIRDVIPELNRLVSILQTLNMKAVKPPMKYKTEAGAQATPPEYEDATSMGAITSVDEDIAPIDYGDAKRSAQMALALFDTALQEGSVSSADLGMIGSPPASGVRALIAGENRDQIYTPRLNLKAEMKKGLAEMFTQQVIQIGGSVELGTLGHKRNFETRKLEGEYETTYKYIVKSAALDAGRASLAAAYGDMIPKKAKREEILLRDDPDGDDRQSRWEEIERIVPAIKINRDIRALFEMAEMGDKNAELEAEIASNFMGMTLKQVLAGEVTPPPPESEQEPKQVLSLFGGSQAEGGQTAPAEEE